MNIIENMKKRNEAMKGKQIVWAIEENLDKLLKCYYKNRLLNNSNERLTSRYEYLVDLVNRLFASLADYKDLPEFEYDEAIVSLKAYKERRKVEFEAIAVHENAFSGEKFVKCKRCNGTGGLNQYSHVKSGICFACDGTTVVQSRAFKKHMSLIEEKKDDLPF